MAQQPQAISDAIIRVRDITVQFGRTRVLDGLNLDVRRGEILGFVGPSGAGKSVLTRTIIGLIPKVSGSIADIVDPKHYVGLATEQTQALPAQEPKAQHEQAPAPAHAPAPESLTACFSPPSGPSSRRRAGEHADG